MQKLFFITNACLKQLQVVYLEEAFHLWGDVHDHKLMG